MVFSQFGKKQYLPKGRGKTVEWRKWNTFPRATKLQEGVIPTGQKFGMTYKQASIDQYGAYAAISDRLELRAYDDMSRQGVQGENITGTMERVRGMMSTIVTAFERQLDSLFGDQALDISTDITVLDNMMAREGLSDDPIHRTQAKPDDGPQDDGIQLEL
jgi:N4-gp56 family major capsid protein